MRVIFSKTPGKRERHLRRQYQNILFPKQCREFNQQRVDEARYLDEQETEEFIVNFHALVEKIASLKANEDSSNILLLKEQLDMNYEQCCGLSGEHEDIKTAIRKLTESLMQAIIKATAGDAVAMQELQQETLARDEHYQMLEYPLVVDLLNSDSSIKEDELAATLLYESSEAVQRALSLFESAHLKVLFSNALSLLEKISPEQRQVQYATLENAWQNLQLIKRALTLQEKV